jgi:hypothetical protein
LREARRVAALNELAAGNVRLAAGFSALLQLNILQTVVFSDHTLNTQCAEKD